MPCSSIRLRGYCEALVLSYPFVQVGFGRAFRGCRINLVLSEAEEQLHVSSSLINILIPVNNNFGRLFYSTTWKKERNVSTL